MGVGGFRDYVRAVACWRVRTLSKTHVLGRKKTPTVQWVSLFPWLPICVAIYTFKDGLNAITLFQCGAMSGHLLRAQVMSVHCVSYTYIHTYKHIKIAICVRCLL